MVDGVQGFLHLSRLQGEQSMSLGSRSFVQPWIGYGLKGKTLAENGGLEVELEPDGVSGI
jgi:hypothetical protein